MVYSPHGEALSDMFSGHLLLSISVLMAMVQLLSVGTEIVPLTRVAHCRPGYRFAVAVVTD